MGYGNPPALTDSVGERKELALASRPSGLTPGGAYSSKPDLISFPYVSLPYAHFPRDDMRGTCQTYPPENGTENNMIGSLMNPNGLANLQTDASLRNVGNNVSNFPRVSQTSHSKMSTRELCQSIDGSNMVPAHCLMDGSVVSAEYQDSEVHMNFMPARGDASAGYSVSTQGREAKTGSRSRSQIIGNFPSLGFSPIHFSYPGNVDGSFLTLGRGNEETRSNSNFSTQDVPSKLEEALSFQHNSRVQETLQSSSSLPPSAGRTVSSQTDTGGSSSLAHNLSCQNFVCNEAGNIRGANSMLNAMTSPSLQTPEADMQGTFSTNFNMYSGCQGDLAVSPFPCSNTSIVHPECASVPALTSESSKPTLFGCQPISNQQHNYLRRSSMKVSLDSSVNSHLLRHQGSSIKHAQLGKLISLSEGSTTRVVDTVPFPFNVKPIGKQIPLSEDRKTQVVDSGPFPVRVQPVGKGIYLMVTHICVINTITSKNRLS
ncbi:uncharacterized protein Fot_48048 [Forsythia ovata]|uniref:Uncharacterized protein n=1 Tax=Forsythia ovata TaxID=205694 RepID=A0ABD1QVT2_9LAMI